MPQTAGSSHAPAWVLLDTTARTGCCGGSRDATTAAEARTSEGHRIVVTDDPLVLSRCFVHCPDLKAEDFFGEPRVAGADGGAFLVRVPFAPRNGRWKLTDFFVYRAGEPPSLHLLPRPFPLYINRSNVRVLSCGDGDHYSVVVPHIQSEARGRWDYDLHDFSSETASWSTIVAPLADDGDTDIDLMVWHHTTKVISDSIGGAIWLAWIDLRRGVLLCNVVDDDDRLPEMRFIQLPSLLGANKVDFAPFDVRGIRDVSCRNGLLRLLEIEYPDLDDDCNDRTATMFTRGIWSETWDRCCTVDSADLRPADTYLPDLFPEIWDGNKLTLNKVISTCPTLDLYDDDVFYLMTKLGYKDLNGWVCLLSMPLS